MFCDLRRRVGNERISKPAPVLQERKAKVVIKMKKRDKKTAAASVVSRKSRLINEETPFAIRESFNLLRTNLMYTAKRAGEGCPIYGVTSAIENVGKSFIVANLALSYAAAHKKVLIIDSDLRAPVQHKTFDINEKHEGLSELLSGIQKDPDKVIAKTEYENLDIIPGGHIPPNPSELLLSDTFNKCLQKWSNEYDVIFIDFPPVGIVSDALVVCKIITGYLFVVRSGKSETRLVETSIEQMHTVEAKILGIVLNYVDIKGVAKEKYYSKYAKNPVYGKYQKRPEAVKAVPN